MIFKAAAYCFRGARCLTPQFANDNSLTGLQDRQRAPLKQLRRCFENHTRNESPMNETLDEEVDYVSFGSIANPSTDPDYEWSTPENDSQH